MPRIVVTQGAATGLERCRLFLAEKNPQASKRAGDLIRHHFELLEDTPGMGRPFAEIPGVRELLIPFGDSGYVALYRFDPDTLTIFVLAFRHQREAGYQ